MDTVCLKRLYVFLVMEDGEGLPIPHPGSRIDAVLAGEQHLRAVVTEYQAASIPRPQPLRETPRSAA